MERRTVSPEEIAEQHATCARIRRRFEAEGKAPRAFVDTYGCQQNEADSEHIRGYLVEMGCIFTGREDEADIIVINTCAVREHAEQRVLGNVGALVHTKKKNRNQLIILCGCMVQRPGMAERIRRSFTHVDMVFGPQELWRFPEMIERRLIAGGKTFETGDATGAIAEGLPKYRTGGVKAWLSVMYGCNNFCSYCIVPYVRGRERSREAKYILDDARALIADGAKDITLLGQNVNSYGKDIEGGVRFPELIRMVNDLDGEFLIRFMTSHPKDATEELFRAMAESEKAARHIHLPFQSGSTEILRRMNRRYTREEYIALTELARKYMPDIVITSDVIVGFPGETEEDFADTVSLIEKVRFDALFTFLYSPRPGTPAAECEDKVPADEKSRRFKILTDRQNEISGEKHAAAVGKTVRVLVDGKSGNEQYPLTARTNGGRLVHTAGPADLPCGFYTAKITDSTTWALWGEIIEEGENG